MRLVATVVCLLVGAGVASAQTAYVGATLFGDVIRVSGSSFDSASGGGETFGGALRAGMPLGEQWGVELEFARSGTIEGDLDVFRALEVLPAQGFPDIAIFPTPQFSTERQLTTISTLAWWNREVSPRVSLVYLGGVAFTRSAVAFRFSYPDLPIPFPAGGITFPRSIEQKSTDYGADVAVGFEARIGMTEHVRLTPGIRLHTIGGGWSIRPGVGLQWNF